MTALRSFLAIVKWDVVLELRRREAVLNMSLFAVLILFIASYALSSRPDLLGEIGPLFLWISILFAGTVGLSRAFAVEKEGGALAGVLVSPLDPGLFYLAKVVATWIYVMAMEVLVVAAYVILFDFTRWERLWLLLVTMALFTFAYVAAGTVIAALTSTLRGGEVVLRILLFPIMIPAVMVVLQAGQAIFPEAPRMEAGRVARVVGGLVPLGVMYLSVGYVLFPKIVEE